MRLVLVADTHITERRGESGVSLEEQVDILRWIGKDAADQGAELILHAGDVFDGATTPAERNAAIEIFTNWGDVAPVICVFGNHDRHGELDLLSRIRTHNEIVVCDRPDVVVGNAIVSCLPWPRKSWLAGRLEPDKDFGAVAAEAMRALLRSIAVGFQEVEAPRVLLAHVELGAALVDSGQPLTGRADVELSVGDLLEAEADVVCLGHIHKFQRHADRIVYAGSPRQTNFGESLPKGHCIIDVERGKPPVIEHRQAPGRELVTVRAHMRDNLLCEAESGSPLTDGAGIFTADLEPIVRLVYEVEESQRHDAAAQADSWRKMWIGSGVHSVKLDARTITTTRVRSEAIREARTNEDRLRAYWEARQETPDRAEAILAKLATLEGEVTT